MKIKPRGGPPSNLEATVEVTTSEGNHRVGADRYGLNQLRHDLRKMKAHGLPERDGKRYACRLSDRLETAFHKADDSIRNIIQLLEAA